MSAVLTCRKHCLRYSIQVSYFIHKDSDFHWRYSISSFTTNRQPLEQRRWTSLIPESNGDSLQRFYWRLLPSLVQHLANYRTKSSERTSVFAHPTHTNSLWISASHARQSTLHSEMLLRLRHAWSVLLQLRMLRISFQYRCRRLKF